MDAFDARVARQVEARRRKGLSVRQCWPVESEWLPNATGAAAHDSSRLGYRGTRAAGEPRNRMGGHPPTAKSGLMSFDTILAEIHGLRLVTYDFHGGEQFN